MRHHCGDVSQESQTDSRYVGEAFFRSQQMGTKMRQIIREILIIQVATIHHNQPKADYPVKL